MNKQRTTIGVVLIIALLMSIVSVNADVWNGIPETEPEPGFFLPEGFVIPGGVIGPGGYTIPAEYVIVDEEEDWFVEPGDDGFQPFEPDCNDLWWHDDTSTECQLDTWCGAYMYMTLRTFETQEACELSLHGEPLEPDCNDLWWFDDTSTECQLDEWCGLYMYESLRTFETQGACEVEFNLENPESIPDPWIRPTPEPLPEQKVIPTPVPLPEPNPIPTPVPLPEPKVIPPPRPLPTWFWWW